MFDGLERTATFGTQRRRCGHGDGRANDARLRMRSGLTAAYGFVRQAARLGHEDGRRAWVYLNSSGNRCPADMQGAERMLAELGRERTVLRPSSTPFCTT